MNRILSRGVGTALAALTIFSCSSDNLTGTNGLSTDDLSADATLIASVAVSFGKSSIAVGDTTTATATLRDWRGRLLPNRTVTWTSSDTAVATVSTSGLVTGTGGGTAVITAARAGKVGSGTITVTSIGTTGVPSVASVSVSLAATSLNPGQTTQATATVRDSANNVLTGRAVTWTSGNTAVATVSSGGLVTAVAAGSSQITASSEGKAGSAPLTVTTSSGVVASPGTVTDLAVAATDTTSATLSFTQADDGSGQPAKYDVRFATAPISWGSATSVASGTCAVPLGGTAVGSKLTCTVLGLKPSTSYNFQLVAFRGTMNQGAVFGALSNVAAGTTKASTTTPPPPPVPVATVTVSPSSATLNIAATSQLSASTRDASGSVLTGRVVTWTSANTAIATVSTAGLVTAKAAGTTQVTATSEGKSGSASITVNAAPPPPPPPPPTAGPEPGPGDVILWQDNFDRTSLSALTSPYATRGAMQLLTNGHSGQAIRFPYTASSWDNLIEKSFPVTTDIYFRYWYRLSPGADPTCGGAGSSGFKWFMPWRTSTTLRYTMGVGNLPGGPSGSQNSGLEFSAHDNTSTAEPNPFMQNISKAKTFKTTADGAWHEYTLHVVTGNGGYEQIWIDGTLVLDNSSYHYDHDPNGIGLIQFPGPMVQWFAGCDFTVDADDLVVWHK